MWVNVDSYENSKVLIKFMCQAPANSRKNLANEQSNHLSELSDARHDFFRRSKDSRPREELCMLFIVVVIKNVIFRIMNVLNFALYIGQGDRRFRRALMIE